MENTKTNEQTHLEVMIRQQKELNDSLRVSANILHLIVQKLTGEFSSPIFEYDNQEKPSALSYIDKLQMNNLDYEAIQRDINYSLDNLKCSI